MMGKRADMGIGMLIGILAVIIVAAVTAGVLLTTTGALQHKSLITGQAARQKITNHLLIDFVTGTSEDTREITQMVTRVSLTPGSDPMLLNRTTITDSTMTSAGSYSYRRGDCVHDAIAGFYNFDGSRASARQGPFPTSVSGLFGPDGTSDFLAGKVAVAVVFTESTGAIQPSTEDWSREREDDVLERLADAFNWWREREPRARIEFAFREHRGVQTGYEPINNELSMRELWMQQALDRIAAPAGASTDARCRAYAEQLRNSYNAHWAFILFVVDSRNDADDAFPGGGSGVAEGAYAIVTSDFGGSALDARALYAHYIGRVFGAASQDGSCSCSETSGYLGIENQNCESAACLSDRPSIMRSDMVTAFDNGHLDYYARAQLGLIDANGNGLLDSVEKSVYGLAGPSEAQVNSLANSFTEYSYDHTEGFFTVDNPARGVMIEPGQFAKMCYQPSKPLEAQDAYVVHISPIKGQMFSASIRCPDVIPKSENVVLYEAYK